MMYDKDLNEATRKYIQEKGDEYWIDCIIKNLPGENLALKYVNLKSMKWRIEELNEQIQADNMLIEEIQDKLEAIQEIIENAL